MNTEDVRIGATVAALRVKSGLSQDQLANLSLLSRPYIANVEAGRKALSDKSLARVASALGVPQSAIAIRAKSGEVAA